MDLPLSASSRKDVLRSEFHVALSSHILGQQDVADVAAGSKKEGRKRKEGMAWHVCETRNKTMQDKQTPNVVIARR